MVFFIDEARSRPPPPPRLLTNVNKKMFFFIEGFPYKSGTQVWVCSSNERYTRFLNKPQLLFLHIVIFYNIDDQHDGGLHHNLRHLDVNLGEVWGDVVVEPAVEDHVAQRRAHRNQVEAEEREEVQPGQG